jgi:hypothetical protein
MLTVVLAVLLAPALVLSASADKFAMGKAVTGDANTVIVPLVVTNEANLTAMDIPLTFSEGVTLQEVNWTDTRTEYFDLKIANIMNDQNKVIIGMLPQIASADKPDLEAGTGVVANLVFRIDDPAVTEINIETFEQQDPGHALMFVYHTWDENGQIGQYEAYPEFSPVNVSLSSLAGSTLPGSFALKQNYPNPFNPSTEIAFDLPKASHVELTVFNVLGQELETLVNNDLAAGSHSVQFDASRYSSGVYFYRIQAEDFQETKKMMLVK